MGKLNHSKGYDIFIKSAEILINKYKIKNWNFVSIGDEERKKIFPNPKIVKEIGFKSNKSILNYYISLNNHPQIYCLCLHPPSS